MRTHDMVLYIDNIDDNPVCPVTYHYQVNTDLISIEDFKELDLDERLKYLTEQYYSNFTTMFGGSVISYWYKDGYLHSEWGPAILDQNTSLGEWYLCGVPIYKSFTYNIDVRIYTYYEALTFYRENDMVAFKLKYANSLDT